MTKPLVILSSSRSGTNYMLDVVRAMAPEAVVLREIFRKGGDSLPELAALTGRPRDVLARRATEDPVGLWEELRRAAGDRLLAAKIFYYHASAGSPIWARLAREARIVHLVRRRLLDAFISLKLAEATGRWMMARGAAPETAATTLRLDPAEVAAFIAARQAHIRNFRARFRDADLHELHYEDISADPALCAGEIARLTGLAVPDGPLSLSLRKQNTRTARDVVANYDEIAVYDRCHLRGVRGCR